MTLEVNRYRQASNVSRKNLDVNGKSRNPTTIPHRPNTQIINPAQNILFQFGYLGIRIGFTYLPQ
jgi:hypothetical protein